MDQGKVSSKNMKSDYKPGYSERWDNLQVTKKVVFWFAVATMILTIVVGFNWGGWVTGGTAQSMATDAVVQRLATICVSQYDQDLGKVQKLRELKEVRSFQQKDFVKEQGWATMPGEEVPNNAVASACAKQLVEISQ